MFRSPRPPNGAGGGFDDDVEKKRRWSAIVFFSIWRLIGGLVSRVSSILV
jgi:hypothetical protein